MPRLFRSLPRWSAIALILSGLTFRVSGVGTDRLINISGRAQVGTGTDVLIAGFIVGAGSPKRVLIRAIGPTLVSEGVATGVLADPVLTLFDATGAVIATNDNWTADQAADMAAAGAPALPAGSRDAVLVATLSTGNYTAIVSGVNGTTGIALVEVYEIDGTARLINVSTRAQVSGGAGVLISGLIVAPGSGPRHVLIRALGPTLKGFGVSNALTDPKLTVYDVTGKIIATNDNWGDTDQSGVTAATAAAGATGFAVGSKDAALVIDLPPGDFTAQVSSVDQTTGVALIEAYDITPGANTAAPYLGVTATTATTSAGGPTPAVFTVTRSGDLSQPLTVPYTMSGTAVSDTDYAALAGSAMFIAGSASTTVSVIPLPSTLTDTRTATLTLSSVAGYDLATPSASVTIYRAPGTLYVANLRTVTGASTSTAYGTSTLQLSADETSLIINLAFSNLSSGETDVHLRLNDGSTDGVYLTMLPAGQLVSSVWPITATSGFTVAQIVAALKAGNIYVSVDTVNFPSGELSGAFVAAAGSQTFSVPPPPPALPTGAPTPTDAARFLTQATFGPTAADITALTQSTFPAWITNQMAIAPSSHRTETDADFTNFNTSTTATAPGAANRQEAWWKISVTGQDQLRQRVAFALSELFVISDQNGSVYNWEEGAANYYDLLAADAFGNYRTLLQDVTLSPMMGVYLSSVKNSKATSTTEPDENYAREVMQLFTIGLNQLQPDGTLKLDATGLPIPTYNQTTVTQMAQVFTGWQFQNPAPTKSNFRSGGNAIADYIQPMTLNSFYHEDAAKTIVNGVMLPASEGGTLDLKLALDALFNHPNTAPFVCRQLIERLVTSNPSPGYVYRVAQVFANNGSGVRGDLGAVVKAILTDYEARSTQVVALPTSGKLKEPLLRVTALLRAFSGGADNGRFNIPNPESTLQQAALRSTTVFNFFDPDYVVPGALASAGLYAPEFQILTATTAISIPNTLYGYLYATRSATTIGFAFTGLPATNQPDTLVDQLNLLLCANSLPTATHNQIVAALKAMPAATTDTEKYRSSIYLVATTQSASIQK